MCKNKSKFEILKEARAGRYYIVEAQDPISGVRGVGLSRRAFCDPRNDAKGRTIAVGRAYEAVYRKLVGKTINSPFMG